MTIPVVPSTAHQTQDQRRNQHLRRRGHVPPNSVGNNGSNVRPVVILALFCLWPLVFIVFTFIFADTAPTTNNNSAAASADQQVLNPGLSFRKYLDRVDIMGYGPTHPRVSVVVVGNEHETSNLISTVESVFRYVP